MQPHIDGTEFGSITIDGERMEHDVVIRLNGQVDKRRKKLSKAQSGTSHLLSEDEARHVFENGATTLIVGAGQDVQFRLSVEAEAYFAGEGCDVKLLPTPEALRAWNAADGRTIGLFHVTC